MIGIGVIHLSNYESWIKSKGFDREWIVQCLQAHFYEKLSLEAATINAFGFPFTYDTYVVILNSIEVSKFLELAVKLLDLAPVSLVFYYGCGTTYLDALNNLKIVNADYDGGVGVCGEETAVAHVDMDRYNALKESRGLHYVAMLIKRVYHEVSRTATVHGGLAYYAGGDNVICFIPRTNIKDFVNDLLNRIRNIKIGVGIAKTPRRALELAAEALEEIRIKRLGAKTCTRLENES